MNDPQYCENCGAKLHGEAHCPQCQSATGIGVKEPEAPVRPPVPAPPVRGGIGKAIAVCFWKYSDFSGRATRAECWWFLLFILLFSVGIKYLIELSAEWKIVGIVYGLSVLLPALAAVARRLHDTGRNGWWSLFGFLPGTLYLCIPGFEKAADMDVPDVFTFFLKWVGLGTAVCLVVLLAKRSQKRRNVYGAVPEPF